MTEKSQNKLPVGPLVSLFQIRHIFFFKLFAEHHPKPFKYLVRANSMTWGAGGTTHVLFFLLEPLLCPSIATVQHILAVPRFLLAQRLGISKINVSAPPNHPQVHIFRRFTIDTSC